MFLVPIAIIVVLIGLLQFIRWIVPSFVSVDVALDSTITKPQCSVFRVKKAVNRYFFV